MELKSLNVPIFFDTKLKNLLNIIEEGKYSKVFVLTDEHTSIHCLPVFQEMLDDYTGFDLIETSAGEENKTIDFCIGIWKTLLDFDADRKALLINLGGGVITDIGGFVASTYKRGIDFIQIPTTLLAQVDASVGGKTGIDIDNAKNMVGTFALPKAVYIEHTFLKTLPDREILSGFAELLKHGLIADVSLFKELNNLILPSIPEELIFKSIEIKKNIVELDPLEKGKRKILNFGHTIGHALESYSLLHDTNPLTHGEAIAIGMVCESYISFKINGLNQSDLSLITESITKFYPPKSIPTSTDQLMQIILLDKKNENGKILCSLLEKIGECGFNHQVNVEDIEESLQYYIKHTHH